MDNTFLKSRIETMQTLVNALYDDYDAFSILGKQTKTTYVTLTNDMVNITQPDDDSINHLGFVIKAIKGLFKLFRGIATAIQSTCGGDDDTHCRL